MVHLNRIYTKTGDDGTTALGDGTRLPKHHLRIAAYGTVDELSSMIGLATAQDMPDPWCAWLRAVQNDLFDVGSDLCVPGAETEHARLTPAYTQRIERHIDKVNENLAPLTSFILPGGTLHAAQLHVARTICRRAERLVCELAEREEKGVNPEVVHFLNRLSDLLFVIARAANDGGRSDVLWKPGAGNE